MNSRIQQFGGRLQKSFQRRIDWTFENDKLVLFGIGTVALAVFYYQQNRGLAISDTSEKTYALRKERNGNLTGLVTAGDLANREDTWRLRNIERNHSIMTQDYHRQLDDAKYRKERLMDNDFLRYAEGD